MIISTFPLADATSVPVNSVISATFSQPMRSASIDVESFIVTQGSTPVAGRVSLDDASQVATFDPVARLTPGRLYTATVTTAAKSSEGNALAADYSWSFTLSVFDVAEHSAGAQRVPAPDYVLDVAPLLLLTEVHGMVQSVSGSVVLRSGATSGQRWAVLDAAGLDTYAELDAAFSSASTMPITLSIPAAVFALDGKDLTVPQTRTLIVANVMDGVPSYQAFEITFHSTL